VFVLLLDQSAAVPLHVCRVAAQKLLSKLQIGGGVAGLGHCCALVVVELNPKTTNKPASIAIQFTRTVPSSLPQFAEGTIL
jgi:hypothetical protein